MGIKLFTKKEPLVSLLYLPESLNKFLVTSRCSLRWRIQIATSEPGTGCTILSLNLENHLVLPLENR